MVSGGLREIAALTHARGQLRSFWNGLMAAHGALDFEALGPQPEQAAVQFTSAIGEAIAWRSATWEPLKKRFAWVGLNWPRLLAAVPPDPPS